MKPAWVWPGVRRDTGRAMPKSISLALPVGSSSRFSGLMSRWMTPTAWAAPRPAQSCLASRSPAEYGSRWAWSSMNRKVTPRTYSMEMKAIRSSSPKS